MAPDRVAPLCARHAGADLSRYALGRAVAWHRAARHQRRRLLLRGAARAAVGVRAWSDLQRAERAQRLCRRLRFRVRVRRARALSGGAARDGGAITVGVRDAADVRGCAAALLGRRHPRLRGVRRFRQGQHQPQLSAQRAQRLLAGHPARAGALLRARVQPGAGSCDRASPGHRPVALVQAAVARTPARARTFCAAHCVFGGAGAGGTDAAVGRGRHAARAAGAHRCGRHGGVHLLHPVLAAGGALAQAALAGPQVLGGARTLRSGACSCSRGCGRR
mmetsp:Transcript_80663/g.241572  ORF Transcript_80663/g.241572 Transcript_80663/m.241572 type:complete len:277 (-) Transcript_80663:168-998(-)